MKSKKRIFYETEEVVKTVKKGYIDLETDYFQFYSIAFTHIASLSNNCAKDFILWMMSRVDDNNEFVYNRSVYRDFMDALSKIPNPKTYSENTLHVSIKELVDNNVIYKLSRGHYKANPRLFWSTDLNKRVSTVKILESNKRVVDTEEIGSPPPMEEPDTKMLENVSYVPDYIGSSGEDAG